MATPQCKRGAAPPYGWAEWQPWLAHRPTCARARANPMARAWACQFAAWACTRRCAPRHAPRREGVAPTSRARQWHPRSAGMTTRVAGTQTRSGCPHPALSPTLGTNTVHAASMACAHQTMAYALHVATICVVVALLLPTQCTAAKGSRSPNAHMHKAHTHGNAARWVATA